MTPIEILYQDEHLIIVNKPSGLLVHKSNIDRHETRFLVQLLRDQINRYVYPVHRLDKPTSGVICLALSSEVATMMQQMFITRQIKKYYLAWVRGYILADQTIDYPLVEQLDKMTDNMDKRNLAQPAITEISALATLELPFPVGRYHSARLSLVELQPQSGRKHQLRRHMKHIFHPIIGDTSHGDGAQNRFAREHLQLNRLALHSHRLEFIHPVDNREVKVQAGLDKQLQYLLKLFQQSGQWLSHHRAGSL